MAKPIGNKCNIFLQFNTGSDYYLRASVTASAISLVPGETEKQIASMRRHENDCKERIVYMKGNYNFAMSWDKEPRYLLFESVMVKREDNEVF